MSEVETEIKCPRCGKVLGEWMGEHIYIKRVQLLIYKPSEAPMTCPKCGYLFDIAKRA